MGLNKRKVLENNSLTMVVKIIRKTTTFSFWSKTIKIQLIESPFWGNYCGEYRIRTGRLLPARQAL
jgi:hypothetical protein